MTDPQPLDSTPASLPLSLRLIRRLNTLKWALPCALAIMVVIFEVPEHIRDGLDPLSGFGMEVLIFAVIGPTALGILLNWVQGAVALQEETAARLQATVQEAITAREALNRLNAQLEQRVEERTRALEEARDALARKNEELTALDQLKSEFVSLVSHELRSPLTNINGGIELLLRRERDLSQRAKKTLATLSSQSQRLTRLVETILDVSALEAGKLALNLDTLHIAQVVHAQVDAYAAAARARRVRVEIDDPLPPVLADENCLSNVLSSLLDNAHKYAASGDIMVRVARQNGFVRVTVADQGAGIPPHEQEHIFDMFYRVDSSDDREVYGYGLGLYASKRLVEAMNGQIWVESQSGQGTQFHFTLPLAEGGSPV